MDKFRIARNSQYGVGDTVNEGQRSWFLKHGSSMLDLLNENSLDHDETERPLKLKDIDFCEPRQGLILGRPTKYGVTSLHNIAGYEIVISRYEDSSMDTIWYHTPIAHNYCKIYKLEQIIHEHLIELIQRDSEWKKLK